MKIGMEAFGLSDAHCRVDGGGMLSGLLHDQQQALWGFGRYLPEGASLTVAHRGRWVDWPEDAPYLNGRAVEYLHCPMPTYWKRGNRLAVLPLRRIARKYVHPWQIRRRKLDLFYFSENLPFGNGPLAKNEMAMIYDIGPVQTMGGKWADYRREQARRLERLTIVTTSKYSASILAEAMDLPGEQFHVVPLGVDRTIYQPLEEGERRETIAGRRVPPRYAYYVGAIYGRKNLTTLLRAFEEFNQAQAEPLHLVIAGGKGHPAAGEAAALRRQMDELRHTPLIDFDMIDIADLAALYRQATVLTHPSTMEGFGKTIPEAMASGCPVICGRNTSLAEVGGSGAVFVEDVLDVEEWVAVLRRTLQEGELQRVREAGFEHVKRFTWENFQKEMAGLAVRKVGGG